MDVNTEPSLSPSGGLLEEAAKQRMPAATTASQVQGASQALCMDVRATIEHIDDIDNVAQTFKAKVYIRARTKRGFTDKSGHLVDVAWLQEYYMPRANFTNMVEEIADQSSIWEDGPDSDHIDWSIVKIGRFSENMELRDFPLDSQKLSIQFQMNSSTGGNHPVQFTVNQKHSHICRSQSCHAVKSLYEIEDNLIVMSTFSDPAVSGVGKIFPILQVTAIVHRRPANYLYNVVLPMFLIVAMVSTTFMIPRQDIGDRVGVSITLVLTAAAYKIVIASLLPAIPYLTLLDKYNGLCTLILVAVVLENGVMGKYGSDKADDIFCIAIFTVFVIANLYFVFRTRQLLSARKTRQKVQLDSE